jgi:hypothetical protein
VLKGIILAGGALLAFLVIQFIYLVVLLTWEDHKTVGLGYNGLPPAGRAAFRRTLRRHAVLLFPILRLLRRMSRFTFEKTSFRHRASLVPEEPAARRALRARTRIGPGLRTCAGLPASAGPCAHS